MASPVDLAPDNHQHEDGHLPIEHLGPALDPNYLPPSAIRIPVPHAPMGIELPGSIPENYWPNIERWIATSEGPKPELVCPICLVAQLRVPGLEDLFPADGEAVETIHVLGCGHAFGVECLERHVREKNLFARCPLCRECVWCSWRRAGPGDVPPRFPFPLEVVSPEMREDLREFYFTVYNNQPPEPWSEDVERRLLGVLFVFFDGGRFELDTLSIIHRAIV